MSAARSDHEQPSMADAIVEQVAQQLRGRGERMTLPRRAVLTVLARDREHLGVDEIARRVVEFAPSVHLTSVYRTVKALTGLGVVQHVHLGHGGTAYHLIDLGERHAHAQCRVCGGVWDLPLDLMDQVADALRRDLSFELDPSHAALSGVCSACADRRPAGDAVGPAPAGASIARSLQ